jgi:hypothetical protein
MPTKHRSTRTASAKKSPPRRVATKSLVYANGSRSFWVRNGEVLDNLVALRDALERMDSAVYAYHATKDKNDFADWVESVLCDKVCAAKLRAAATPAKARTVIAHRLKFYRF